MREGADEAECRVNADVLDVGHPPDAVGNHGAVPAALGHRRRSRTAIVGVVVVALLAGLAWVSVDEVRVDSGFDRAHRSLEEARRSLQGVRTEVATVTMQLRAVDGQVALDSTALSRDTTQLQGLESALVGSERQVSDRTSMVGDLRTCLGGVQQALNALAVGDQGRALGAFDAVTTSCTAAVTADA